MAEGWDQDQVGYLADKLNQDEPKFAPEHLALFDRAASLRYTPDC